MADKSIGELIAAQSVTPTDLFVLEQNGTAKKLTGQILENWLVSFADGHGGIQSIVKQSTSGLKDTYRITLADTTTFDFVVTNGKGITGISKTSTSGLADTYTIRYNDSTTSTFTVTNGAKGDKGDNAYTWFKYASEKPTSSGSSMGDEPDNWLGVYSGNKSEPPTDPMEYKWSLIKGEKGQTGDPATIITNRTEYQVSESGTIIPSGIWSTSIPVVTPGKFLWARTTTQFNTGTPNYSYSISRFGIDGTGAVSTVNGVAPDEFGNVELTAEQLNVLGLNGGTMEGPLHMNGQVLDGLNDPTEPDEAVRKSYADKKLALAGGTMEGPLHMNGQVLDGLNDPTEPDEAVRKSYADKKLALAGGTMEGPIHMNGNVLDGLNEPTDETEAVRKGYVDKHFVAIANNAGGHNSVYRGKNLGTSVTPEQWAAIKAGTFDDLFVGDYWVVNGTNWRIAAFDYYLNTGDTLCTDHHLVIVPDTVLYAATMNDTDTNEGAYAGSKMRESGLNNAKTLARNAFGSEHILSHRLILPNACNGTTPTGISNYDSTLELMSERHLFGAPIWLTNVGAWMYTYDHCQLPLFALNRSLIKPDNGGYWLRETIDSASFAAIVSTGSCQGTAATTTWGYVRPMFCVYQA